MTAPPYTLRPATESDLDALYELHRQAMGGYITETWGPWNEAVQRPFFQARLERGLLQVVEVGRALAGILELDDRFSPARVENIELAPDFQNRGIGTALLRDVMDSAAGRGVEVHLQVLKVNPAARLYRRLGFVANGETDTHFQLRWPGEVPESGGVVVPES